MITCDFFGGLGNNLFQLATVYAIHKRCGVELQIPSRTFRGDIHLYGQEPNLELERLFDNQFTYNNSVSLPKYVHPDAHLETTDFAYLEVPLYDNTCYHGYFQSERYFLEVDISKEFILKQSNIEYIKNKYGELLDKKNISLHYRLGGDRVKPAMQHYHKNVSLDYYRRALELLSEYNQGEYNILVFSDRVNDCKELLKPLDYPFVFIENENNVIDFTFMSLCDINIISNSTFSWWAAYMNQSENKKVIVPKSEWFGPGYAHFNLKDTFPESWIKL
jgi:hypothetical protein